MTRLDGSRREESQRRGGSPRWMRGSRNVNIPQLRLRDRRGAVYCTAAVRIIVSDHYRVHVFLILSRHVETTFRENMRVILKLGRGFFSAERASNKRYLDNCQC